MWMWMWMCMSLLVVWTRLSLPVVAYLLTDARSSSLGKAPAFARSSIRHSMTARDDNNNDLAAARRLVADGMNAFRNGQVEKSIDLFDQAERVASSLTPYLWQRGLSYYYVDRFDAASRQFRVDVQVNPNDAEEIVWDIASQLRLHHDDQFPVPSQLQLPRKDPRRIMVRNNSVGWLWLVVTHS
jgi:tetratricopeptide (TPR) repeat protein